MTFSRRQTRRRRIFWTSYRDPLLSLIFGRHPYDHLRICLSMIFSCRRTRCRNASSHCAAHRRIDSLVFCQADPCPRLHPSLCFGIDSFYQDFFFLLPLRFAFAAPLAQVAFFLPPFCVPCLIPLRYSAHLQERLFFSLILPG